MTELSLDLRPEIARAGVLLAWSGGLDSTVLLHLLREWAARSGAALHALHIDHGLRASSREDVAFCRRTAAKLGVPLWVETLAINPAGSTQQNARIQRYAALARVANRLGLGAIATAHHADDALETALLNLRRGTSSAGLSALAGTADAPIPAWPGDLRLERPLSGVFRREIRAFARAQKIDWHEDPSNATTAYPRNQLRHDILPDLTEDGRYAPGILRSLENLADENHALNALAKSTLRAAWLPPPDGESIALRCAPLYALPPAIVGRTLQLAARRLPAEVALTRAHRASLADAIAARATRRLDIRAGVIHITPHVIILEVARGRGAPHLQQREAGAISLQIPATQKFGTREIPWFGSTFLWQKITTSDAPTHFYDFDAAHTLPTEPLILRGPKPGDRIRIPGLAGHKSVTSLLAEAQIPDFLRWRWPCLVEPSGPSGEPERVVWVCGIRHGDSRENLNDPTRPNRLQWKPAPGSLFELFLASETFKFDQD